MHRPADNLRRGELGMVMWIAIVSVVLIVGAAGVWWRTERARKPGERREQRRQRNIARQQAWDAEVADWVRKRLSEKDRQG